MLAFQKKKKNDSGVKARTELSPSCIFVVVVLVVDGVLLLIVLIVWGDKFVFLQVCVVCELGVSGVLHSSGAVVQRGCARGWGGGVGAGHAQMD